MKSRFSPAIAVLAFVLFAGLIPAMAQDRCNETADDAVSLGSLADEETLADARLWLLPGPEGQASRSTTACFEMALSNQVDGQAVTDGDVSVRLIDPDGETELMAKEMTLKEDRFIAELTLAEPGDYRIQVAARFPDNRVRHFEFSYGGY